MRLAQFGGERRQVNAVEEAQFLQAIGAGGGALTHLYVRYEAGITAIPDDVKRALCARYGVTVEHLLGWGCRVGGGRVSEALVRTEALAQMAGGMDTTGRGSSRCWRQRSARARPANSA